MKVSIIGAGNVGSSLAERVLAHSLADVLLVDIAGDLAKGKAFDLSDASPVMGYKNSVQGTSDYKDIAGSDIICVTAGFPRRPGMSRDDLIGKNGGIVRGAVKKIKEFSKGAIILIVTNPLDVMTYLAYKEAGCERKKILGMAGNLDTARFKALLAQELGVPHENIETFVLGSHGDTMVPLVSKTLVDGKPLERVIQPEKIQSLIARTRKRGGEIVGCLKSGSAYFSPSAACLEILRAIIKDEGKVIPCSCVLEGEYGITGCAIGVPAKVGKNGVSDILEWKLAGGELGALQKSAEAVKNILVSLKQE